MSKSILIIDTPENCYECPCFMDMGWRCQCRLDIDEDVHDGRPEWCPLKEYKEAIPVEWLKEQLDKYECSTYEGIETVLELWEKENERNV